MGNDDAMDGADGGDAEQEVRSICQLLSASSVRRGKEGEKS